MVEPDHLPVPPSEADEDRVQLYDVLTRNGIEGRDAYLLTQLIENMASANLIHRFENKLEAVNARLEAQARVSDRQFRLLIGAIATTGAVLSIVLAIVLG